LPSGGFKGYIAPKNEKAVFHFDGCCPALLHVFARVGERHGTHAGSFLSSHADAERYGAACRQTCAQASLPRNGHGGDAAVTGKFSRAQPFSFMPDELLRTGHSTVWSDRFSSLVSPSAGHSGSRISFRFHHLCQCRLLFAHRSRSTSRISPDAPGRSCSRLSDSGPKSCKQSTETAFSSLHSDFFTKKWISPLRNLRATGRLNPDIGGRNRKPLT
jgi:hypothetical protein